MLSEKAREVFTARYAISPEETWEEACVRVSKTINAVEDAATRNKSMEMIRDMKFIPGGRILRNAGRPRGSLFNCYHLPIGDSIKEIARCNAHALELWSEGGGVGINFSSLRPAGAPILGKGGSSSGLVSFMRALDGLAATIESGGSRRAASLGSCDVGHPEIHRFIDAKLADGAISYFNISVNITHDFLESVMEDKEWPLKFHGRTYSVVSSTELWNKILSNMIQNGEPGILVWDNLIKNNSYYFAPISGVNPCGEAVLAANDVCDLGSLVLSNFVDGSGRTKWSELEGAINHAVRFLDNVIDVNKYIIPENQQMGQTGRRIGIGVMGLAEYLFAKGLRYGERDSLSAVEDLIKFIRDASYVASIRLSSEKGSFPAFNATQYHSASFVRKLPPSIRKDIRQHGIRNCTVMALAPTGTISLLPEVTGGIEPLFSKAYIREDRISTRVYVHPILSKSLCGEGLPSWFVDSTDLAPADHLNVQAACQRYTDGAVSKTINIPNDFKEDSLSDLLLEHLFDLKGVTVYRDGSRDKQVLRHLSIDEVKKSTATSSSLSEDDVKCATGACEL
jgi:ribonucleoside-diphosphate reductase alpha chain